MKKALLTLAVAFMALTAGVQAQETTDWKWVVGGTGNFTHDKEMIGGNLFSESTIFRVEPFVGYQLSNRWRVGFTFGYTHARVKETNNLGLISDLGGVHTYRMGPYVHFDMVKYKRWILWTEAEVFYVWSPKSIPMDADPLSGSLAPAAAFAANPITHKISGFKCTIKPGITYVLDKHVNIDFNLNLLGWYYFNANMTVIDGNATVASGTERSISRAGLVLDLLEASPSDYWEQVSIGITFKF